MKKKKSRIAQWIMLISGLSMMIFSFLIYKFGSATQFLNQIHSEVFGVGLGLVFVGGVWLLAKIRLD